MPNNQILSGHVYVIECDHGLIKIGKSVNPKKRISGILSQSGLGLVSKFVSINTEFYASIESELHHKFKQFRSVGEWFTVPFNDVVSELTIACSKQGYYFADAIDFKVMHKLTPSSRSILRIVYETLMEERTNIVKLSTQERRDLRDLLCVTNKTITESIKLLKHLDIIKEKKVGDYMVNPDMYIKCGQENKAKLEHNYNNYHKTRSRIASLIKSEDVPH